MIRLVWDRLDQWAALMADLGPEAIECGAIAACKLALKRRQARTDDGILS